MVVILIAVSWGLSLFLTPLAGWLAVRCGLLDRPASHKFHARSTPLLGGLALYAGMLAPLLILAENAAGPRLRAFAAAVSILFLVGLWDDWRHLSVAVRLAAQAAAAAVLLAAGYQIDLPFPAWILAPLSLLWIVGITNAVNLLDSMDGAAAGVTAVASAGFVALASGSPFAVALAAVLLGATLGFLPYNFHRARLFMGDAGSLVLGFGLATVGLDAEYAGVDAGVAWMLPVLLLAVPLFDTTLVSWSRLRQGKNPMTHPGKDHLAHRLARHGLSVRGAVVGLYLLGAFGGVLAFLVSRGVPAWGIGIAVAFVTVCGLAWLDRPALLDPAAR